MPNSDHGTSLQRTIGADSICSRKESSPAAPESAPAPQPEVPPEPKRAKKPAPRAGAKRAPARPRPEGEKKAAAPKTTVKKPKKVVKDQGGEKKE